MTTLDNLLSGLKPIAKAEGRECGDCSMCCKLLKVGRDGEDFQKPQGVWCSLIGPGKRGCSVHATKPTTCRDFKCSWLGGAFREKDRPDKSRVVVCLEHSIGDEITDGQGNFVMKDVPVWCVYEREPGAAFGEKAAGIMKELEAMVIQDVEDGPFKGPFPIGIISGPKSVRKLKLPGMKVFVPCYRPGESPDGKA